MTRTGTAENLPGKTKEMTDADRQSNPNCSAEFRGLHLNQMGFSGVLSSLSVSLGREC